MSSPRLLPAKQVVVGLVAASVLAAGLALGIEHAASSGSVVSFTQAAASPTPSATPKPGRPGHGNGFAGIGAVGAKQVIGIFTKDTGLTIQQVLSGIQAGKTLDDIAGSNAAKVKADYLAQITTGLDQAVTRNVISKASESHLIADAKDAIDQLFAAKLGNAGLGGFGGFHGGGGEHKATPAPSPTAAV